MARRKGGGVGSAPRRRDRQFRAFRRHEQLTVRMELAAALHHLAQRVEGRGGRESPGRRWWEQSRSFTWLPRLHCFVFLVSRAMTASIAAPPIPFSSCRRRKRREAKEQEKRKEEEEQEKERDQQVAPLLEKVACDSGAGPTSTSSTSASSLADLFCVWVLPVVCALLGSSADS